jgi:hypothetical protein
MKPTDVFSSMFSRVMGLVGIAHSGTFQKQVRGSNLVVCKVVKLLPALLKMRARLGSANGFVRSGLPVCASENKQIIKYTQGPPIQALVRPN